eukprot:5137443-Amphidinium_carterae.2
MPLEAHIFLADFAAAFPIAAGDWFNFQDGDGVVSQAMAGVVHVPRWRPVELSPWSFIVCLEPLVKCLPTAALRLQHELQDLLKDLDTMELVATCDCT